MKYRWLLILLIIPQLLLAQIDAKYAEGAIPMENGRVSFKKELKVPHLTQDQIFDTVLEWANRRYYTDLSRVAYANKEEGQIAVVAEEYMVFKSTLLALDRALAKYRVAVTVNGSNCEVEFYAFRYDYNTASQKEPEVFMAEEIITDEYALNKKKTKLNRSFGKFRTKTIDLVDELTKEIAVALQVAKPEEDPKDRVVETDGVINIVPEGSTEVAPPTKTEAAPATPVAVPVASIPSTPAQAVAAGEIEGYRSITPDRIPGNIIKMLAEDWMLVTAGNDEGFNMMTASWGGLAHIFNKPTALCFINPARHTYKFMEKGDTYTFTFYTEAYRDALNYCGTHSGANVDKVKEAGLTPISTPSGAKAFKEAWLIIECKKLYAQPINADLIRDDAIRAEYVDKAANKMYIGEIVGVWMK